MKKDFKENLPQWYQEINEDWKLVLSNDIDSLWSCYVLELLFGCKINGFYTFNAMGTIENSKSPHIGVDLDLAKGRCFSNHVTIIDNPKCISLNKDINQYNYFDKFAGSTLITIMSLYDMDLSKFTEEQLEVLICIDTAFKQYFFNQKLFTKYYSEILEYPQFVDIVSKHDKNYFYKILTDYGLEKKINVQKGYLQTNIKLDKINALFGTDIQLPNGKFQLVEEFKDVGMNYNQYVSKYGNDTSEIFSNALTNRNFVKVSLRDTK